MTRYTSRYPTTRAHPRPALPHRPLPPFRCPCTPCPPFATTRRAQTGSGRCGTACTGTYARCKSRSSSVDAHACPAVLRRIFFFFCWSRYLGAALQLHLHVTRMSPCQPRRLPRMQRGPWADTHVNHTVNVQQRAPCCRALHHSSARPPPTHTSSAPFACRATSLVQLSCASAITLSAKSCQRWLQHPCGPSTQLQSTQGGIGTHPVLRLAIERKLGRRLALWYLVCAEPLARSGNPARELPLHVHNSCTGREHKAAQAALVRDTTHNPGDSGPRVAHPQQ